MECTDPATLAVGPGFTWHMTAEILLLGEGWMIFSTSSCPSLIALSSLPASIPNAGLFPATLLAEDLACPASHSSYRCSAFFFLSLCSSMDTSMFSSWSPALLHPLGARTPQTGGTLKGRGCSFPISMGHHSPRKGHGVGTEQGPACPTLRLCLPCGLRAVTWRRARLCRSRQHLAGSCCCRGWLQPLQKSS